MNSPTCMMMSYDKRTEDVCIIHYYIIPRHMFTEACPFRCETDGVFDHVYCFFPPVREPVSQIVLEPLVMLLRSHDHTVQKTASLALSNFALNGPGTSVLVPWHFHEERSH